ncbi:hypothetical protein RchiOBHm_Chr2g0108381 [Rosa chinensis]|uniref:Uncharacterized protein n=1 Tax=Rosa chinensis TaxID=74649 RepID=A0A2P6RP76_ROSCH|nr:hypothetical protein RchiOBHm_Chr2g0108381 [Rosa chinensis]
MRRPWLVKRASTLVGGERRARGRPWLNSSGGGVLGSVTDKANSDVWRSWMEMFLEVLSFWSGRYFSREFKYRLETREEARRQQYWCD